MRERFNEKQIDLAQKIHSLIKEIYGEGYWKPRRCQIVAIDLKEKDTKGNKRYLVNYIIPMTPTPDHPADYLPLLEYLLRSARCCGGCEVTKEDCFPIPTWRDCRTLLKKMGWKLSWLRENSTISLEFIKGHHPYPEERLFAEGQDDHSAICEALLEALKRKAKEVKNAD